jgi:hypothetical protein
MLTREEVNARQAAYVAEQEEKAKKARQERNERMDKASARIAWINDGGNPDIFELEWPRLKGELQAARIAKAADRDQGARDAQRSSRVSSL